MSRDLSIATVLADPMIRAMMRADRVEPQAFERLLRSAARGVGPEPARAPEAFGAVGRTRETFRDLCCA